MKEEDSHKGIWCKKKIVREQNYWVKKIAIKEDSARRRLSEKKIFAEEESHERR